MGGGGKMQLHCVTAVLLFTKKSNSLRILSLSFIFDFSAAISVAKNFKRTELSNCGVFKGGGE